MRKKELCLMMLVCVLLLGSVALAQEGDEGVELVGETVEFQRGDKFSSATFGDRPDTVTDVSGALRESMYTAEVEPNPAGSGNGATEIKIYFKFDGALAGRPNYPLFAWVVAEDALGRSSDLTVNWSAKIAQLIGADSDVNDTKLFPITIVDGEDIFEFEDSVDGKTAFVTWCATNLVNAIAADEQLKEWADTHNTSVLTHYQTGFRLVREGDVFIKRGEDPEGEVGSGTAYSLSPRRLYFSPSGATYSTLRTSDYISRRGGARMDNPNYNYGSLTKRNEAGEQETYYVTGLRRPSLYTGELVFRILIVTRHLQFETLYHDISGQEAIDALVALRVLKVEDGKYVPDNCFHASAKTRRTAGSANWASYGGWDMFSEADLERLNELYPISQ